MPAFSCLLSAAVLANSASAIVLQSGSFDEYVRKHGRQYVAGSEEYRMRQKRYEAHLDKVQQVNGNPRSTWRAAVNGLADRTHEELVALRGYNRHARPGGASGRKSPVQLLSKAADAVNSTGGLPAEFTWAEKLKATSEVMDQSACGSCWAFSSAAVLRAHSELFVTDRIFSAQQIVSCTTNPANCGGSGGCDGATAELAMDYVMRTGCVTDPEFRYSASDAECPKEMTSRQVDPRPNGFFLSPKTASDGASFNQLEELGGSAFGMMGWQRLPENELAPVLQGVYENGPAVVSLAAGYDWNLYSSGVMDNCERDAIIDHAVMLMGWGVEEASQLSYWHIQNSWGSSWGEDGRIRILKGKTDEEEQGFCGWDTQPEIGSGCDDGPAKVRICGHCGILNDVVQPTFKLTQTGWWATKGGRSIS